MKKTLLSLLAVGAIFTASAQMADGVQARIYAYDLQQTEVADKAVEGGIITSYTLTFKTNTAAKDANSAKVHLLKDGEVLATVAATADDETLKSWTAVVDASVLPNISAGEYNWSVEVSANPVESFTEIATPYTPYRSYGLAVNTNPESDYFGTAYMTHQYTVSGRMANGLYAYDPLLKQTNYKTFDFIGETSTAVSPRDMNIAEDGRLFMTNYVKDNSNVYWVSPDLESSGALFGGNLDSTTGIRTDNNGNYISGLCGGIAVRGGEENTQLYVTDHSKGAAAQAYVMRYDLGTASTWTTEATWGINSFVATTGTKASMLANTGSYSGHAMEVTENGFWVAAYRGTPAEDYPDLFYYNEKTGNRDFISTELTTENTVNHNNSSIALALNERLGLVAYTVHINSNSNKIYARVLNFKEEDDKMAVSYEADYDMSTTLTKKADAMAFDYAGNLYALTSGNERFTAYALPLANNTCTTPAKKALLVKITEADIATGLNDINVDTNAPVEYYNLQGVKVENPSNGIFIKKQGAKATKVVL